jgi:hypothetical protein
VEKLSRKRQEAVVEQKDEQFLIDLDFEIENLHARLEEAQDNISECQSNIMELMEIKVKLINLAQVVLSKNI